MKYLGVDFGLRRIGLATSEGEIASPYKILEVKNLAEGVEKVLNVISQESIDKILVGMPEGKLGKTVLGFIRKLKKSGLQVEGVDETLSTRNATYQMIEMNIPKEKRKFNDAYSAAIILQAWLDNK